MLQDQTMLLWTWAFTHYEQFTRDDFLPGASRSTYLQYEFYKSTNPHLHWHWHGLTQSLLALAHSPSSLNLVSELWLISASTQGLQKHLWPSHKSWQQTCLVSQNQWMLYYRINNLENKILFLSASLEIYRETQFTLDDKDWEHSKEVWWRSGRNQNVSKIGHVCNMLYSIHAYFAHICLNLYWFC